MNHHPKYQIILAVDFNQYIYLREGHPTAQHPPPTKMTIIGFTACVTLDLTLLTTKKVLQDKEVTITPQQAS